MLEDYLEDFRLLEGDELPDLLGGSQSAYSPGLLFRAGVTATPGEPVSAGDHPALRLRPMLLHEWDVTLAPGDRVERVRDGAVYRVLSRSADMQSPAFAALQVAQVPVERVVIA